jgi:hypothetical protein
MTDQPNQPQTSDDTPGPAEPTLDADLIAQGWTCLGTTDPGVFGGFLETGPGRLYFRVEDPAHPAEVIEITARHRPGPLAAEP